MEGENRVEARKRADFWKRWGLRLIVPGLILLPLGYFFYHILLVVGAILILTGGIVYSRSETWQRGAEGEEEVIEELKGLGPEYEVFHDITLPGESQNIDHVVVGENGVFILETKNLDGAIECEGDSWSRTKIGRKGTPYEGEIGSPSKQVKGNAVRLKNFLEEELPEIFEDRNIFFQGIVVFTDPNAEMEISNPKVSITRTPNLIETIIKENQKVLNPKEIGKIARVLGKI